MPRLMSVVLVFGVITSCAAPESQSTSTSVDEAPDESMTSTTTAKTATTTTEAPAMTTTTESAAAGGHDCLIGVWTLDNDAFAATLVDVFAEASMEAEDLTVLDGTYMVELAADGTLAGERDGWGFSVATSEGTFTVRMTGTESGTWSATDSTITVEVPVSEITVSATVEADGQEFDLPSTPVDVPDAIATDSTYTCSDESLTVTGNGVATVMHRS